MACSLVALALICIAVVSGSDNLSREDQTLPKLLLGFYEMLPESQSNFGKLAEDFRLPQRASFSKGNSLTIADDGESYRIQISSTAGTRSFDLAFKLGEISQTTNNGKNVEYEFVFTVDGDSDPVLHGTFRDSNGDVKVTFDAKFNKNGFNATYTRARDGAVLIISYRRTLPAYVFGAFESVPARRSVNYEEFNNAVFPLPRGLKWTENVKFWLSRHGDHFIQKVFPDPTYQSETVFNFNEKSTTIWNGQNAEYVYTIAESTPSSTTIQAVLTRANGTLKVETVYDEEGATTTITSDQAESEAYFKRVVPWLHLGMFELVPEKSENFQEFLKAGGCKFGNVTKRLHVYQQGDEYVTRKTPRDDSEKPVDIKFKLNIPTHIALPIGKTKEFTYKLESEDDRTYLRIEDASKDIELSPSVWAKPQGLVVAYQFGNSVATRFYRRILPKVVFGAFESDDDNEDRRAFAAAVGVPELLKKVSIEFSQIKDEVYAQKISFEGEETIELIFMLGDSSQFMVKGKTFKYTYYFLELDGIPTFRANFHEINNGPTKFHVVAQYKPEGYTATYTYDNGQKQAKRTYRRNGSPVPLEVHPVI